MDGERKKRKVGWDKHENWQLVHEVKQDVDSRDEARHTEKSDRWFSDKQQQVWHKSNEFEVYSSLKRDETAQIGWLTGDENFVSKEINLYCMRSSILASEEIQEHRWCARCVRQGVSKGVLKSECAEVRISEF